MSQQQEEKPVHPYGGGSEVVKKDARLREVGPQEPPVIRLYGFTVRILSGKDLIQGGHDHEEPDLAVKICIGYVKHCTQAISKTQSPEWNESFSCILTHRPKEMKLFLKDKRERKGFIGKALIELNEELWTFKGKTSWEDDVRLSPFEHGSIRVRLEAQYINHIVGRPKRIPGLPPMEKLLNCLRVTVVGAKGIKTSKRGSCDPYCMVKFGESVFQTYVKSNNHNPQWGDCFPFWTTKDTMDDMVSFKIFNKGLAEDELLGVAYLKPRLIHEKKEIDILLPLTDVAKEPPSDSKLMDDIKTKEPSEMGGLELKVELAVREEAEDQFYNQVLDALDVEPYGKFGIGAVEFICSLLGSAKKEDEVKKIFEDAGPDDEGFLARDKLKKLLLDYAFVNEDQARCIHAAAMYGKDGVLQLLYRGVLHSDLNVFVEHLGSGPDIGHKASDSKLVDLRTGKMIAESVGADTRADMQLAIRSHGKHSMVRSEQVAKILKKITMYAGEAMTTPESVRKIPGYIALHQIDMDQMLLPVEEYKTFDDFFHRKLKPDVRHCDAPDDPTVVVSPIDGRMMAFNSTEEAKDIWIKGKRFSIEHVFGDWDKDGSKAARFRNGPLLVGRLSIDDYHRWHYPVTGKALRRFHIPGDYHGVKPAEVNRDIDVFTENARAIAPIETKEFGLVVLVAIGAISVASIYWDDPELGGFSKLHPPAVKLPAAADDGQCESKDVHKFDPQGYFGFGGSAMLLFFEPGRITWDERLVENSRKKHESILQVGNAIGTATKK